MKCGKKCVIFVFCGMVAAGPAVFAAGETTLAEEYGFLRPYGQGEERDCSAPTGMDAEAVAEETEERGLCGILSDVFAKKVSKTVLKTYVEEASIPEALNYREYIDGEWYGGWLPATDYTYKKGSKLYEATFSGTLYKQ